MWPFSLYNTVVAMMQIEAKGECSEMPVLGKIDSLFVMGFADSLTKGPNATDSLVMIEVKTRTKRSLPHPLQIGNAKLQVQLYRYLYDKMRSGQVAPEDILELIYT